MHGKPHRSQLLVVALLAMLLQACGTIAIDTSGHRVSLDAPHLATREITPRLVMVYRDTPADIARLITELRIRNVMDPELLDPQSWSLEKCGINRGKCQGSCPLGSSCRNEAIAVTLSPLEPVELDSDFGVVKTCRCRR